MNSLYSLRVTTCVLRFLRLYILILSSLSFFVFLLLLFFLIVIATLFGPDPLVCIIWLCPHVREVQVCGVDVRQIRTEGNRAVYGFVRVALPC